MLIDILLHNQNMNSRNVESGSAFGGNQNPPNAEGGHDCINMMSAANFVTRSKYYYSSQPKMRKEYAPLEIPLQIDKPKIIPRIPKGFLKHLGHNPNACAS